MNSQMRRIDLVCKLFGPFFIGVVDGVSTETAILVNLGMNCISVVIEYFSIAKVRLFGAVNLLRHLLTQAGLLSSTGVAAAKKSAQPHARTRAKCGSSTWPKTAVHHTLYEEGWRGYVGLL